MADFIDDIMSDATILNINDLPQELVVTVFTFLSAKDVCQGVALVCKYWYNLSLDEILWKELALREPAHKPSFYTLLVPFLEKGADFPLEDVNKRGPSKKLPTTPVSQILNKMSFGTWKDLFRCKNVLVKKDKDNEATVKTAPTLGTICKSTASIDEERQYEYYGQIGGTTRPWRRHGYGICIWKHGSIYVGEWKDGKREGQGQLFWEDGGYYDGAWNRGLREGFGKLVTRNFFVFEGIWTRNELQNEAYKYWIEDGKLEEYRGMFHNTKARGYGNRSYADGTAKYAGFYWKDRRVGFGVYTWPNGDQYAGIFNVGRRNGRFIEKDSGKEFEQQWNEVALMDTQKKRTLKEVEITENRDKIGDGAALLKKKKVAFDLLLKDSPYFSKQQLLELRDAEEEAAN